MGPSRPRAHQRLAGALRGAWATVGPIELDGEQCRVRDVLWALPWFGLGVGIIWVLVFAGAWRIFGEHQGLRLAPAAAIVIVDFLLTSRFQVAGVRAIEAIASRDDRQLDGARTDIRAAGALAAAVLVVLMYGLLLAIPAGVTWWPSGWRYHLHWMYPRPIFRPLVLMPMWSCWSLVLAAGIGRACQEIGYHRSDPAARMAGRASPAQIFVGFLPAAILTAIYASRDGNLVIGLGISLGVFVSVYVAAMAAALRWRGQNAVTILACGLVGRLAFLLGWLFTARVVQGW